MRLHPLSCLFAAALLTGCAGGMLQGSMYRLDNGAQWPFGIQTSYGTGNLTASDPQSGESFTGQYTATARGGGNSFGTVNGMSRSMSGQMISTTGTVQTYSPPDSAAAKVSSDN